MTNREIADRHIDASERQDAAELEALVADDVVWDLSRSRSPYQGVYRGTNEVRTLLEGLLEAWGDMRFQVLSTHESGNWLAMEIRARMRGRESGVEMDARGARVYEFRGGKIARFVQFQDMVEAREYVDAQP